MPFQAWCRSAEQDEEQTTGVFPAPQEPWAIQTIALSLSSLIYQVMITFYEAVSSVLSLVKKLEKPTAENWIGKQAWVTMVNKVSIFAFQTLFALSFFFLLFQT